MIFIQVQIFSVCPFLSEIQKQKPTETVLGIQTMITIAKVKTGASRYIINFIMCKDSSITLGETIHCCVSVQYTSCRLRVREIGVQFNIYFVCVVVDKMFYLTCCACSTNSLSKGQVEVQKMGLNKKERSSRIFFTLVTQIPHSSLTNEPAPPSPPHLTNTWAQNWKVSRSTLYDRFCITREPRLACSLPQFLKRTIRER